MGDVETLHTEVTKKRKNSTKEKLEQEIPTAQISENSPEDESPPKKKKKSKKEKQHQEPEAGKISDSSDKTVQQSGNQLSHDEMNGGDVETLHTEVTKNRKKSKKEKLEREIPTAQLSENSPKDESPLK